MNNATKKPKDMTALVQWQLLEEKGAHSKDKELLIGLIGAGMVVLGIIVESYIFSLLTIIATGMFIYISRQKPKKRLFTISDIGIFLDEDFLACEEIEGFNIIDDPGARARLVLQVKKIIHINEIVPIYDIQIEKIEHALKKIHIPKNEELKPGILDRITVFI